MLFPATSTSGKAIDLESCSVTHEYNDDGRIVTTTYTAQSGDQFQKTFTYTGGGLLATESAFVDYTAPVVGYTAQAVHFDADTLLNIAALTADDSGLLSLSAWVKRTDPASSLFLFNLDPDNNVNDFHVAPSDTNLFLQFATSDFSSYTGFTTDTGIIPSGVWNHILLSANMNLPAGNKITALYVNDIQITTSLSDTHDAFEMSWSPNLSFLSAYLGGNSIFDAADIWFAPGVSLLAGSSISESDRRKFISASGKPVNPSGFPASAVVFSGDHTTFSVNQGTGGVFTLTGVLTDASSSPSD